MEVGVDADRRTIQKSMEKEGFVDGIMKHRTGILQETAEKRVKRTENQLDAHLTHHD